MVGVVARRRGLTVLAALFGVGSAMLLAAPAASAHAVLASSSPNAGELIRSDAVISRVELRFDEPIEVSLGAIQVVAPSGTRVDTGRVSHVDGAGARVAVAVRGHLSNGSYLVVWRVVSADSHPVHGSFTFSIGQAGPVAAAPSDGAGTSLGFVLGVTRIAGYAGLLLVVGVIAFLLLCQPSAWVEPRTRRLLAAGLGVTGAATVLNFGAQAAFDVGDGWSRLGDPSPLRALADTRLGHAHLVRLLVVLAIWATLSRTRRISARPAVLVTAGLVTVLGTVAVEGHSGQSALSVGLDMAHLAAAGTWIGRLVVLCTVALPAHRRARPEARVLVAAGSVTTSRTVHVLEPPPEPSLSWEPVRRFSTVALCSVAVLVATGVVQALRQVPEWGALSGTTYGRLLLVKVGLVALVLMLAAVSRTVLHTRRRDDRYRATTLARSVAGETALLVVVLAVASALVATTPARASYRPVQERTITAGPVTVELTAVPAGPRTVDVHLYTFGTNGLPADVTSIRAEAAPTNHSLNPVSIPLLHAGTGHFLTNHLLLPRAGTWTLTLIVKTGEFDAYTATAALKIR
jgi:copper transport protein